MSDINLNLNLLTKRYEASTKSVVSTSKNMTRQVLADSAKLKSALQSVNRSFSKVEKPVFSVRDRLKELGTTAKSSGSNFASLGKTIFAGVGVFSLVSSAISGVSQAISSSVRSYLELENAQIAVAKTTTLTKDEIKQLTSTFQDLSGRIPTSTNELLRLGSVAGQLGVDGVDNIALFAETIAKLNSATDLVGEEGARSLARILNVTGEGAENVDNLASAIVGLGNNFAATESEITGVATEVAKSTSAFKIGSANVVGLATALKSLGQQAQLGGSVVGKTFREINKAVQEGGQGLENFAKVAGVSSKTFADTFSRDKARGFQLFIEGLGNIDADKISGTLETLGLKGDEVNKVLPVLAQRSDLVGRALRQANKDFKENVALNEEAARAYNSTSSRLDILGNNFSDLGVAIAGSFSGSLRSATNLLNGLFDAFRDTRGVEKLRQELRNVEEELLRIGDTSATPFGFAADTSALEKQRDAIKLNILELAKLDEATTNPLSIDGQLNTELEALQDELRLTEQGFDLTFGADPSRAGKLREEIEQVKNQISDLNKVSSPEKSESSAGDPNLDKRNKKTVQKEKELQIQITQIKKTAILEREQAELEATQLRGDASEADLERIRQIEREKLNILFEAEAQKAQLNTDTVTRDLELELIKNERLVELDKLKNDALKDEAKKVREFRLAEDKFDLDQSKKKQKEIDKIRKQEIKEEKAKKDKLIEFEKNRVEDTLAAAGQLAGALSQLSKKGSGERKAFAIADATINTYLAATRALAEGGPYAGPVLAAAAIASGLANVSKITSTGNFATGGIIGGSSNTGDRLTANVNSGEMILNRRQQTELFNQSNGNSQSGGGMSPEMVSQIVKDTVSNMNVTLVANDNEIARSASRGSINGVVIGVSE